jgi:hypothetical protein
MSTTIRDKIRKLEAIRGKVNNYQGTIVMQNTSRILALQKNQFTDGYGNNDKDLFNVDRRFNGTYRPNYKKQGLYDFFETGAFIRGLFVKLDNSKQKIIIDSRGKGSGEKSLFFAGYTNLFGLDSKNTKILNNEIILPELIKFLKQNL